MGLLSSDISGFVSGYGAGSASEVDGVLVHMINSDDTEYQLMDIRYEECGADVAIIDNRDESIGGFFKRLSGIIRGHISALPSD
ncbi:MAG: hypothetical protein GDA39_00490 [Hyphomonadaceae bacterium]|nr:hypothetical protein [Hyphomonadaceae bacterium]MBC6411500.1 hypothetical protein [Hyphomonadaceae bacterium]